MKLKILALTLAMATAFSTVVMAAPSPMAGVVVMTTATGQTRPAQIKTPTTQDLNALTQYITANLAAIGGAGTVKTAVDIVGSNGFAPNTPIMVACAGIPDGAKNIFAYIRLKNGQTLIVPCTVKNGYVGFIAPAAGTVAIVEVSPIAGAKASR